MNYFVIIDVILYYLEIDERIIYNHIINEILYVLNILDTNKSNILGCVSNIKMCA